MYTLITGGFGHIGSWTARKYRRSVWGFNTDPPSEYFDWIKAQ